MVRSLSALEVASGACKIALVHVECDSVVARCNVIWHKLKKLLQSPDGVINMAES